MPQTAQIGKSRGNSALGWRNSGPKPVTHSRQRHAITEPNYLSIIRLAIFCQFQNFIKDLNVLTKTSYNSNFKECSKFTFSISKHLNQFFCLHFHLCPHPSLIMFICLSILSYQQISFYSPSNVYIYLFIFLFFFHNSHSNMINDLITCIV
jgi:hypothetical protein